MGGFNSAYLGAEPWVGSKTATALRYCRKPQTQDPRRVQRMHRKEYRQTDLKRRSRCNLQDSCSATSSAHRCWWTRAGCWDTSCEFPSPLFHHAGGFPNNVRLLADGNGFEFLFLRVFKRRSDNARRSVAGDDPATDCQIGAGHISKSLETRVRVQSSANVVGWIRPLDSGIHAFGPAENRRVDLWLVDAAVGALANKVERVADNPIHGRMQVSRLNFWRMVTIGL